VRDREALGGVRLVAEEQHVDVDRARGVADGAREVAAELRLDRLARVQQLLGSERGLDAQARVEERWLVEDLADRVGVIGRGAGEDDRTVVGERVDRGLEVGAPVADVRAQAEVAPHASALRLIADSISRRVIELKGPTRRQ
jgi:hypothetical protein